MKVNELMIGDWVNVYNAPLKVLYIKKADIMLENNKGGTCLEVAEDLDPIPLTEEILAKNFVRNIDGDYRTYTDFEDVTISDYYDKSIWEVTVDEIEFANLPTWKMYVSHVHELQQALRLAKVDKEITL